MSKEHAARPLNAKSESKFESTHFGWLWFLNRNSISKCSIDWSIDLIVCDGRNLLMIHLEAIAFHVHINVNVILQSKIMMIFVLFLFFYLWKSPCERAIAWQHIALKEHNLSTPFSDFPIFHSLRQSTAEPIVLVCRVRPQEAPQNKWKSDLNWFSKTGPCVKTATKLNGNCIVSNQFSVNTGEIGWAWVCIRATVDAGKSANY